MCTRLDARTLSMSPLKRRNIIHPITIVSLLLIVCYLFLACYSYTFLLILVIESPSINYNMLLSNKSTNSTIKLQLGVS